VPSTLRRPADAVPEKGPEASNAFSWKKFALFSCGDRKGVPFLNLEILWTPMVAARLSSHSWLDDTNWKQLIETAEVGEVFDGKGVIFVVRIKESADDYEP
jgi:hypothetical protein